MNSFLELGGDSLAAMRLQSGLLEEPDPVTLSLAELLSSAPISKLTLTAADTSAPPSDKAAERWIPLTRSQLIPWLDNQADPESTRYLFHAVIDLDPAPPERLLRDALQRIVAAFPVLSPAFRVDPASGRVLQRLGGLGEAEYVEAQADEGLTDVDLIGAVNAGRPFQLGSEPLLRWTLVRRQDGGARLVHTEHHLVHDGVSFNLILDELREPGSARGDFGDFAAAEALRPVESDRALAANLAAELQRSGAAPAIAAESTLGSRVAARALRIPVPPAMLSAARRRAEAAGISTFSRLLTDFGNAVARELDTDAVAVAVAVANRPPQFASTIGMFVSTFPIVVDAGGSDIAARAAADQLRAALDRPSLDYAELVSAVRGRDTSLPFVGFSEHVQRRANGSLFGSSCTIRPGIANGLAKFSLNVILVRDADEGGAELEVEWDPRVWSVDAVWRIWTRYARASAPGGVGAPEVGTGVALPLESSAAAFCGEGGEIRYAEIASIARVLDNALSAQSGGDRVVAVLGHASPRVFAVCAAAHVAGAAFVPIDPDLDEARIGYILSTSGARVLIDLQARDTSTSAGGVKCLSWADLLGTSPAPAAAAQPALANRTAYIIFTSGSTGVPKGVAVPRPALAALAEWGADLLGLKRGDQVGQTANSSFDASIWEVWPALAAGGTVHVADPTTRRDPVLLREWTRANGLRTSFSPTPVAELLARLEWDPSTRLEVLGAGGSALHSIGRPQPFRLLNLYGPTETTSVAAYAFVDTDDPEPPTLGLPVPYARIDLVGETGEVVSDGDVGELWIAGAGVADGYVNDEDMTDARFIIDPRGDGSTRVYRSGDLGRRLSDGRIVYLGRSDRQVKVSGVRLELGELEGIALSTEGVTGAIAGPERTGERLVLFLTTSDGSADPVPAVRARLPIVTRHSRIVVVPAFPLTNRGKVDFAAMVEALGTPSGARGGEVESFVRELIGASDLSGSWYSSGGTSFTGARLVAWLSTNLGVDVPITEVLNAASVTDLISSLERREQPEEMVQSTDFTAALDAVAGLDSRERIELAIRLLETVKP